MFKWFVGRPQRLAFVLVIGSVAGGLGWLWWSAVRRPEINFLPVSSTGDWILYPRPAIGGLLPRVELGTDFRKSFVLERVPKKSELRLAGFHRYSVSLNGHPLEEPTARGRNWKIPGLFPVSDYLNQGTNEIRVTVFNTNGPPALRLSLRADDDLLLKSDETWESSFMGADWTFARFANRPIAVPPGNALYGGEEPGPAFAKRWPTLALFGALSVAICLAMRNANVDKKSRFREWLPVAAFAGLWLALFVNNLSVLPISTGYDASGHMDYIAWIQEHRSLPLASDGWEMFQPPLYYIICASILASASLTTHNPSGIMLLRIFGLLTGVAHFVIVWKSLCLLFPRERARQIGGLLLAASLAPVLFLSQYVSNEGFAAVLVSGCVYLDLRILQPERPSWKLFIALGFCLGAALLAKSTAILVLPPIFGAFAWKAIIRPAVSIPDVETNRFRIRAADLGQVLVALALCFLVSGWHYYRAWQHFGSPVIGVWEPKSGFSWWQDNGYRTASFYLHFGQALIHPWFSALKSFSDGIYSTLWGDGLLGGLDFRGRPPWNYDLMAIGYWLALVPTVALLIGGVRAVLSFLRQPTAEWFLVLGLGFLAAFATLYFSMQVPYYCTVKAFYALPALVPFCALGAFGLAQTGCAKPASMQEHHQNISRWRCIATFGCWVILGAWAINSYGSFWISRNSTSTLFTRAKSLMREQRLDEASKLLKQGLTAPIKDTNLKFEMTQALADTLLHLGNLDEGISELQMAARLQPDNAQPHFLLGNAFYEQNLISNAIAEYREALRLQPNLTEALNDLAWIRATSPDQQYRDGSEAVRLAERACQISQYKEPLYVGTLASAYAEMGRFVDAIATATQARELARLAGRKDLMEKDEQLLNLFTAHQPYRQTRQ